MAVPQKYPYQGSNGCNGDPLGADGDGGAAELIDKIEPGDGDDKRRRTE